MFKVGDRVNVYGKYGVIVHMDVHDGASVKLLEKQRVHLGRGWYVNTEYYYAAPALEQLSHEDNLFLSGNQDIESTLYLEDIFI